MYVCRYVCKCDAMPVWQCNSSKDGLATLWYAGGMAAAAKQTTNCSVIMGNQVMQEFKNYVLCRLLDIHMYVHMYLYVLFFIYKKYLLSYATHISICIPKYLQNWHAKRQVKLFL